MNRAGAKPPICNEVVETPPPGQLSVTGSWSKQSVYGDAFRERLRREVVHNVRLKALDEVARKAYSVRLSVVLLHRDGLMEVPLQEHGVHPPEVCSLLRSLPRFKHSCAACHASMIMASLAQGMTKYTCFAGVSVLTVISGVLDADPRVLVAASSCHFRHGSAGKESTSWDIVAHQAGIDSKTREQLRQHYIALPRLDADGVMVLGRMVHEVAQAIRDILDKFGAAQSRLDSTTSLPTKGREAPFWVGSLHSVEAPRAPMGGAIIPVVQSLVAEWPHLGYSIKEISAVARITPNYFSHLFRLHTGYSFSSYVAQRRLLHCQQLLKETDQPIGQIGVASGFRDVVYFHRWFKARTGMTPRAWRNKKRTSA